MNGFMIVFLSDYEEQEEYFPCMLLTLFENKIEKGKFL